MNAPNTLPNELTDPDLIAEITRLAGRERKTTADLLRALIEFDTRRLYLGEGYPSLFAYCTKVLNYSEHAALNRIEVARASRRFPALLECIRDGSIHLTGARMLTTHLTNENSATLMAAARYKSKREIEELIAALHPRQAVESSVRRLPVPAPARPATPRTPAGDERVPQQELSVRQAAPLAVSTDDNRTPPPAAPAAHQKRGVVEPLAPERYKVQFTITRETRDRLRQVEDLMRHTVPHGDPAVIFDRALTLLLNHLQRQRFAATTKPRSAASPRDGSRHIPAAVQREVWKRDSGQCAFVGTRGRCGETGFLEFHHVWPFAADGPATTDNIQLRCRAHNQYEASLFFGPDVVRERAACWG